MAEVETPPLDPNLGLATGQKILNGIQDVEIDPQELQELFHAPHPLEMSRAQRAVVVEGLRRARATSIIKRATASKKRAANKMPKDEAAQLALDDLDLDLTDLL